MVSDGVMNVKIHGTSMLQKSPTYYQTQRIGAFICDGVANITLKGNLLQAQTAYIYL